MKGLAMGTLYYTGQELLEVAKTINGEKTSTVEKYRGRISFRDESGKRRYKTKTLNATSKRAAKAELTAWRSAMENEHAAYVRNGGASIGVADTSITEYVKRRIETKLNTKAIASSTAKSNKTSLVYIKQWFGDSPVKAIRTDNIEDWIAFLYDKGYSDSTVRKAFLLLKATLDNAVDAGVFDRNPMAKIKTPPLKNKNPGINSLDLKSAQAVLDKLGILELSPVSVAAYIAIYAGLRRAEVCGLQWRDLDKDNQVIWVKRAIQLGEGGAFPSKTKTDKIRTTVYPDALHDVLARWREMQRDSFAKIGTTLKPDSYVIGDPDGFFHPTRLSKEWTAVANLLGILGTEGRAVHFHDLRHTFATVSNAIGLDIKVISSCLGHASAVMTLDKYASVDPDAKRQAAAKYGSAIGRKRPTESSQA